jgi:hypothetical protein
MKRVRLMSAGVLLLLFGAIAPSYARQDDAKPPKQEQEAKPEKQQEAKPEKQQEQAKPAKPQEQAKTDKQQEVKPEKQQEAKPEKQQEAKPEKQQEQVKPAKQEEQAKSQPEQKGQQHAQRTPAEEQRQRAVPALRLSVSGTGRIPDARFHSNFGREHAFRIGSPRMVDGYSRFQYGGYWFGFVQPWPDGWYYTDNVYVDYIDGGYYLYNPSYPGARVSISVVI